MLTTVNELLDTEEDMVDLYLTSKILTGHRRATHEHVEAELLLEMYARQLHKTLNECSMIATKIEATEQQVTCSVRVMAGTPCVTLRR